MKEVPVVDIKITDLKKIVSKRIQHVGGVTP